MAAAARKPRAASAPKAQLPEPGWVKVQKVQLIRREIREVLAPSALELLFKYGELVIEAGPELGRGRRAPGQRFYATVMVTVDLRRCAAHFCEPADVATADKLAELMLGSVRVRQKLVALARQELARLAGVPAAQLHVEIDHHVRSEGTRVFIDGDAMVSLEAAREASKR
ncbi:hypothetical protein OV090_19995 [Nannocystis sp. RBIL2]|uniref:hypothetical protein n=1 Tax=Nannocystis sp. RBIL2 TaxID=2996788 RepID=UPI00226FB983|nr:hypothetical protein [Nannocystis sp. RBIL2]MCY1067054.1 hypothetical protein [Nannocystis sp. RBIL2]